MLSLNPSFLARGDNLHRLDEVLGESRRPLYTPVSVRVMALGDRRKSSAKALAEPGFHPRSLAESVRDTYRWCDEHGMLGEGT